MNQNHAGFRTTQNGLTLVELMVGMVVGLIVVAIAGTLFFTALRGSDNALRSMKLNQELRAAMNYMTNDIRRAGFWAVSASPAPEFYTAPPYVTPPTPLNQPYDNPYTVRAVVAGVTTATTDVFVANDCIMYSYDDPANTDPAAAGGITSPPRYAFRRVVKLVNGVNVGVIEVPSSNALGTGTSDGIAGGCAATVVAGGWAELTDPNAVNITQLDFSFEGSRCENLDKLETVGGVTRPTNWQIPVQAAQGAAYDPALVKTAPACFDPGATGYPTGALVPVNGDRLVESRQVRIMLTGNHVKDPTVTLTLDETIKLPNNRAVIAPGP